MKGRYQFIRRLATGGMAEIHLARTVGPGGFEKRLVIKRILPHLAERPEFLEMFFAEARIAAQLAHPNIVQIFDFGEEDGSHLIAMEYVDGLNLKVLARWAKREEPLSCTVAARIISQACEGLAYAHEFTNPKTGQPLRLIHRDVSAENIMVSRSGTVKILDFGIARIDGESIRTGPDQRKGKIAYMSIEQIRGETLDLRADVFALGVVLFQLLAGERPWERTSDVDLIRAMLEEPPSSLRALRPDVPEELEAIVMRALLRDRAERFQSCRELQLALETFITRTGETLTPSTLGAVVTHALARGAASRSFGRSVSGPHRVAQVPPASTPQQLPVNLVKTTPGVTPLLKAFAKTVAGMPSPALLARLRGEAASDDDPLGPEPTTDRMQLPAGAIRHSPPGEPARAPARTEDDQTVTLSKAELAALRSPRPASAGPDAARTVSEAELFAPPPPPRPVAPLPEAELFAPPPPPRPVGAKVAPLPEAELFAPPPPPKAPAAPVAPLLESELFAPPPPPKRSTAAAPGAPLSEAELFAPPPPPRAGGRGAPVAALTEVELFAPPPPPKRPSESPRAARGPLEAPDPLETMPALGTSPPRSARVVVRGYESAQVLEHRTSRGLPPAVLATLQSIAPTEQTQQVLRRFPLIAARLMEIAPDLKPRAEQLSGALLDALLLADEHRLILGLIDRTRDRPFGRWLCTEFLSPARLLALTDRLTAGPPVDAESLHGWLVALGASAVPALVSAIEKLDAGTAQDVLGRALAALVAADPSLIIRRLEDGPLKSAGALAFVLEATGSSERSRVFSRLYTRRDVALTLSVMTGRARARSVETLTQLEAALGDRLPEVRLHALKLISELDNPEAARRLFERTEDEAFERLSDDERTATFSAIAQLRDPQTFTRLIERLDERTSLIGRKQSIARKLSIVAGLASSHLEEAQNLLARVAEDRNQPGEVMEAASRALVERRPSTGRSDDEEIAWLRRLACLDLCGLVRAASVIDVSGGQLDPALDRLHDTLRRLVTHLGRFDLVVGGEGLVLGNASVTLHFAGTNVAPQVARWLSERDLQSLTLDAPVSVSELRAFLLQLCDPDGSPEPTAHVRCTTFSGRAVQPVSRTPEDGDPVTRATQLYRAAIDFLLAQRRALMSGGLPDVMAADELLRQLTRTWATGRTRLLSVLADPAGDDAFAVHAVNTACLGMAFASDLQLGPRALREIAEVALFWTLAELRLSSGRRNTPGAAMAEDDRLRLATLFLVQETSRRAVSATVVALDAGLEVPRDGHRGAGHIATIVALAEAFDALALTGRLGHAGALEQMQSTWCYRFNVDLLDLFVAWATEQCGTRPPPPRS